MNLKFSYKFLLTISVIAALSIHSSQAKLNQQQKNQDAQQNAIYFLNHKFNVPFILLLSSQTICVAQLPLISDGKVTEVYRLLDDPNSAESAHDSSLKIADAREFEQMPKSSTSLGKSEWQQIAAGEHYPSHDREEVGKRTKDAQQPAGTGGSIKHEEEPRTVPRRKRSGSTCGGPDDGNSLLACNNGTADNDRATGSNAVQQSSSAASMMNVTSARSTSEQEEVVRGDRAEDDEPKNGAPRFCDFDVHMELGIVFVADTRGRIHRFKLSAYGNGKTQPEIDYTNSIGTNAAVADSISALAREIPSSNSRLTFGTFAQSDAISVPQTHIHDVGGHDDSLLSDNDDANKVGLGSGAYEKFGRHPTASGYEQSGKFNNVQARSDASSTSDPVSNTLAGPPSVGTNYETIQRVPDMIDSARPRIIWSRTRLGIVAHPGESMDAVSDKLKRTQTVESGALPTRKNLGVNYHQTSNDSEQMESESEGQLFDQRRTVNVSGGSLATVEQTTSEAASRQRSNGAHEMQTEVAVDWLNKVLFVLDDYRLLALDYDGDNELVLIDDFKNRPVNLKVDPINGFLFWLEVGKFHNAIYKLDLGLLVRHNKNSSADTALISHHYAHPIVTNLQTHEKIFIIDHKHSKIYVPSRVKNGLDNYGVQHTDDTEIFATPSDDSNVITHMNSSSALTSESPIDTFENNSSVNEAGNIYVYNLDGTDFGPLRSPNDSSHPYNFSDILDITLDTDKGFFYWLTNDGRDLSEEYQDDSNAPFHSAQHNLEKKYSRLMHINRGSNQPNGKQRLKGTFLSLFQNLASLASTNRLTRSGRLDSFEDQGSASSLNGFRYSDSDSTRFSRNAPLIVLGLTCFGVLIIYLIYAFVSQPSNLHSNETDHQTNGSSSGGSFIGESHVDSVAHTNGFIGASTISRWISRPSSSSADTSTFHRTRAKTGPLDSCDFESSTNYDRSNAIDEHYRDSIYDQATIQMEQNCLSNISEWPSNMCEMSNRLYIPKELLEDETLSTIHRVSIDQLVIEKRAPLGEGHFGTVLQGTITCTIGEKDVMLNKASARHVISVNIHPDTTESASRDAAQSGLIVAPPSTSSGHGSSSISEFITANSAVEVDSGDYLAPKSNTNSAMSDYSIDNTRSSIVESCISYSNPNQFKHVDLTTETKFKVAIKKLKENASPKERSDFLQEAKHLAKFDHPNIVRLVGICLDRGSTLIVMELMLGGDLIRYMQENKPAFDNPDRLTLDDLLSICLDIANACCYLEEREHIHRDLAARNCLVSSRRKEDRVVKLADFGLARDIYKDSYYKKLNDSAMPLKWMAPECFVEQKFTIKSDVWSFGVVMWEVMSYCQDKPYNNVEPFMMRDHLIKGLRLGKPEYCCEDVYRLMNECWQLDPIRRPTFEECRATLIEIKNSGR